jgi:hypothetical protein
MVQNAINWKNQNLRVIKKKYNEKLCEPLDISAEGYKVKKLKVAFRLEI